MTSYVVTIAIVTFLFFNVVNTQDDGRRPENGGRRRGKGPWMICCKEAKEAGETGNFKDAYMDCFIKMNERCGITREEIEDVLSKSEELASGNCPKPEDLRPIFKKCHEKMMEIKGEKINQCCQDASKVTDEEKWEKFKNCMKDKNKREGENQPGKKCENHRKPFEEIKSFVMKGECEEAVNEFKRRISQWGKGRKPEKGPSGTEESTE
ncbi:uncharacterized protein LOC111640035 isoform X2 [Centruroides sculpturatus]|uniref:uncharacterized protein LOC111640035 isoform X2 n=1 Tax=Centruroides sculpturatus TaxID=218467 RepID=UPI000C6D4556|nr:uncharacterized protein LOC111640035 isoform X2 [Centruroides sculpturatus]